MTVEQLWQQGWLGVAITVVGGLILAALLSTISATARTKFWRPLFGRMGTWLNWLKGLKVSTARQREATGAAIARLELDSRRFKEVCDFLEVWPVREDSTVIVERIAQLREAKDAAWAHAQSEIEATKSLAQRELAEQVRRGGELAETARELGRTEGHAEAMAEVEAQRATPQLRPTWRVVEVADGHFDLRNSQSGFNPKDIQDVSIEAPMLDFAFDGSNQWPGYFPGMVGFEGRHIGRLPVRFVVRWRNSLGDPCAGEAILEGKPRRAVIL